MSELDIEQVKERLRREREARALAEEKSSTLHGGDKIENQFDPESEDLDEAYPIIEGRKRTKKAEETESEEEKSPLNK